MHSFHPHTRLDRQRIPRRGFLGDSAVVVAGAVSGMAAGADLGRARTVSIFHTTDLHGRILPTSSYEGLDDVGGFARCATCIRQWRAESPYSLTVDVGDVVQGTLASMARGGQLMFELFNALGYDAWTLGNHDFDWGPEKLEANLTCSQAAILTANLERGGKAAGDFEGTWKKVVPWTIREVGGFRIGLVGLITPGLASWLDPETLGGTAATDPGPALERAVAECRDAGAEAVVVLGHMGWRFEDDYANPVRGILAGGKGVDVYLAGHSHQNKPAWFVNDVLCTQASYYGLHCGRVDLSFDLDARKLVDRRVFTLLMDDRYDLDPQVMELARPDLALADEQLARQVATVTTLIKGKGRGSRLGTLFCESFAAALAKHGTPVDGVFHGTFLSGDLAAGRLTVADCWKLIPYENLLVVAELSAAELLEVVAEDAGDPRSDRTLWPFTVVKAGADRPARLERKGELVDPQARFRIAFNSYDAQSGGRRLPKLFAILSGPAAKRQLVQIDSRSALIASLLDRGTVG
ncbi:MAG: bifunctional metallophosphatase/5'-nucleotidase [Planctomycetota bacterium]|nr:MAG: bifunctional metallophosphatase/5'-nucleotidase [Planctomycetota bacterium]